MTRALCTTCLPHYQALAVPDPQRSDNDILVLGDILREALACDGHRGHDRDDAVPRCRICGEPMRGFARTVAPRRRPRRIAQRAVHEVCGLLGVLAFAFFMGFLGMYAVFEASRDILVIDSSVLVVVWHVWAMIVMTSGYAIGALCLWLVTTLCCRRCRPAR